MFDNNCDHSTRQYDHLPVHIYSSSVAMGYCAAEQLIEIIHASIAERGMCTLIMATGNSQLPLYTALRTRTDVAWERVTVMHMDEYVGMSQDHPASFRRYMCDQFVNHVPLRAFYGIRGDSPDVEAELRRYSDLLEQYPADACVLGIGENGHLAFNDPPADFGTSKLVHVVKLDRVCRQQQVGEGHFTALDDVPTHAISLTVPALLSARRVLALVPEKRKAQIVLRTLTGPITPDCPASILRTRTHTTLFLDADSASYLPDLPA
jgi:glucosamine-6-phosphate deaminase